MFCHQQHLDKITEKNNLLFKFLWDNKGDKIKRTEMIADYQDGGQEDAKHN